MNILVIAVFPPVKAAEAEHAYQICRHLAEAGVHVSVVTQQGSAALDHENVTLYPIMRDWSWREIPRLAQRLKRSKPDAVLLYFIGFIYNHHPMVTFVPTLVQKLLPGVPCVTLISHMFGSSSADDSLPARLLHKAIRLAIGKNVNYNFGTIFRDSRRLIVLSERHKDLIAEQLPSAAEKCVLIPPPLIMTMASGNREELRQRGRNNLHIGPNDFLLAYFGYISLPKGIETLLQALSQISQEKPNVRLALIGDVQQHAIRPRYAEEMYQLTKELHLEDRVMFTGSFSWDSPEASLYLYAADACVLPFDEGVHLNNSSFAAAVNHGLPVITTQGPALEEQFQSGVNVLLCPPCDPNALAMSITTMMNDQSLCSRLHIGSLALAQEWFSWENATQRTVMAMES